ncbi:hypothetical protein ACWD0J_39535 [Streptomyces sp. NPDC003011]
MASHRSTSHPPVQAPPVQAPAVQAAPKRPARSAATLRRPAAKRAERSPRSPPRFPHGPLVVRDGDGSANGIVLDDPATTLPKLVERTLESGRRAGL